MRNIRLIFKDYKKLNSFLENVKPLPQGIKLVCSTKSGTVYVITNPLDESGRHSS